MKHLFAIVLVVLSPQASPAFEQYAALSSAQREKTEFAKALTLIMATASPRMAAEQRSVLVKAYIDQAENKAQVVEPTSNRYWRSGYHETQAAAGERSLEACQLRFGNPCAAIAVNEQITTEGSLVTKDMPRLRYAGPFVVDQIPVVRLNVRKRPDVQNYDRAMEPKAIAIHPWGRLFIAVGKPTLKETEEAAIVSCNQDETRNGQDGPCFLYAANNEVVLSRRLTAAPTP